jgi:dihydrofolate reductase
MAKLKVFNSITLDGYFTDKNNDMSWAHQESDPEWNEFVEGNASGEGVMVFGRITYEMMKSFWPTPAALKMFPVVAKRMNEGQKVVFSRTLDNADWENTKLVKGDLAAEIRKMKAADGEDLVIMGSGTIVSQLAQERLIDEYQFVINPIVLGDGRTLFADVKEKMPLRRTSSRTFGNGNVVLCYEPKV